MFHPVATLGAAAGLAGGLSAIYGTFVPQSQLWGRNVSRGTAEGRRIALTFDDGPTSGGTNRVLAILARAGVPASFFAIGRNVQANPSILREIDAAGHVIGNHSFDHHHLSVLRGWKYWDDQLATTNEVIESAIGRRPRFFRPPIGIKFAFAAMAARGNGLIMVTWSRRGRDGVDTSVAAILDRLADTGPGDIITLHDGADPYHPRTGETTCQALPDLIARLRDRGLTFVRLDELIGESAYESTSASARA